MLGRTSRQKFVSHHGPLAFAFLPHCLNCSDDAAKLYLNGKVIYAYKGGRTLILSKADELDDVELIRGLNLLVFKVVNENGDWQGSIRLTDKDGKPIKGIKVTLTPP